jgi:hypothetical protein
MSQMSQMSVYRGQLDEKLGQLGSAEGNVEELLYNIGELYFRLGWYPQSREHYEKSLKLAKERFLKDPSSSPPRQDLLNMCHMLSTKTWSAELDDAFRAAAVSLLNAKWLNPGVWHLCDDYSYENDEDDEDDDEDEDLSMINAESVYCWEGTWLASASFNDASEYRIRVSVPKRLLFTIDAEKLELVNLPLLKKHVEYFFDKEGAEIDGCWEEYLKYVKKNDDGSVELRIQSPQHEKIAFIVEFANVTAAKQPVSINWKKYLEDVKKIENSK